MNKEKAYISIVLDESGSMMSAYQQTINGFNEQIQSIKENLTANIETLVTLITFNGSFRTQFVNVPADQVKELDTLTYKPSGMTALYDAMGEAINILEASPDINNPTTSVLMVVISDGEENSSKMFTAKEVKDKLERYQEEANWTVTYMGANQNVQAVAQNLGVNLGNVSMFSAASAQGYSDAYTTVSASLDGYMKTRSAGLRKTKGFYSDDKSAPVDNSGGIADALADLAEQNASKIMGLYEPEKGAQCVGNFSNLASETILRNTSGECQIAPPAPVYDSTPSYSPSPSYDSGSSSSFDSGSSW